MAKNKPQRVILHCSATQDYPKQSAAFDLVTAETIDLMHKKRVTDGVKWRGIGYHYFIRRGGLLEKGRHPDEEGAHCYGHNENTLGVCLAGTRWPTAEQVSTLLQLYTVLYNAYGIEWEGWLGHYELNSKKTCPGVPMVIIRAMLHYFHEVTLNDGRQYNTLTT